MAQRQAIVRIDPNTDLVFAQEMPQGFEFVANFKAALSLYRATRQDLKFAAGLLFDEETGDLIQIVTSNGKIYDVKEKR